MSTLLGNWLSQREYKPIRGAWKGTPHFCQPTSPDLSGQLGPFRKIVAGAQQLDILELILQPLSITGLLLLQSQTAELSSPLKGTSEGTS
jgi:hypothetical protein